MSKKKTNETECDEVTESEMTEAMRNLQLRLGSAIDAWSDDMIVAGKRDLITALTIDTVEHALLPAENIMVRRRQPDYDAIAAAANEEFSRLLESGVRMWLFTRLITPDEGMN